MLAAAESKDCQLEGHSRNHTKGVVWHTEVQSADAPISAIFDVAAEADRSGGRTCETRSRRRGQRQRRKSSMPETVLITGCSSGFGEATGRLFTSRGFHGCDYRVERADETIDEVADVILKAATDLSDRLRYIATEDIVPLVAARRETSEEAYLNLMREKYRPRIPAAEPW
jgi:hypothetical protein